MTPDLSPEVLKYRGWRVAAVDEDGARVIMRPVSPRAGHGVVVDLDQGILFQPTDLKSFISKSGVWTDRGLPSTQAVLEKVKILQ